MKEDRSLTTYSVGDVLAQLVVSVQWYMEYIKNHNLDCTSLGNIIETLVNDISKLKTILLEFPSRRDKIN